MWKSVLEVQLGKGGGGCLLAEPEVWRKVHGRRGVGSCNGMV